MIGTLDGKAAVKLEAIADGRLWIWLAFFDMEEYINDINNSEDSTLVFKHTTGRYSPPLQYMI